MTKRRRLTDDERRLWERFTAGIERLAKEASPPPSKKTENETPAPARPSPAGARQGAFSPEPSQRALPEPAPTGPVNTDRRTWERLKRGQIAIESRLDLHGRTQNEAHQALNQFLAASAARGHRCVLIVTGKGTGGNGILRQMVPRWLAEENNQKKVITYCTAQPRHGGAGALYVLIRRQRSNDNRRLAPNR